MPVQQQGQRRKAQAWRGFLGDHVLSRHTIMPSPNSREGYAHRARASAGRTRHRARPGVPRPGGRPSRARAGRATARCASAARRAARRPTRAGPWGHPVRRYRSFVHSSCSETRGRRACRRCRNPLPGRGVAVTNTRIDCEAPTSLGVAARGTRGGTPARSRVPTLRPGPRGRLVLPPGGGRTSSSWTTTSPLVEAAVLPKGAAQRSCPHEGSRSVVHRARNHD